uniref:Gamma-tubulin complex component n=1 Tax=Strigamia maritima TaxID=126957 RepID=T1JKX1_STRMM
MAPARQRFEKLSSELIQRLTGFEREDANFGLCIDYVLSSFHYHHFLDVNSCQLRATIQGLCDKFTIHSQKEKAVAFLSLTRQFLDSEVFKTHSQLDVQYSILSLLVYLTNCPTTELNYLAPQTRRLQAENEREKSDWAQILGENDVVEQFSSDEFSDWTDSDEERVPSQQQTRQQRQQQLPATANAAVKTSKKKAFANEEVYPQLGRAWLKENVMPSYWAGAHVIREPMREHECNRLNRQWEAYLEESGIILSKSYGSVLTETQIIREVLWLLQGSGCVLHDRVCLSHLTSKSLESMLSEFARYGAIVSKLGRFVDDTCGLDESETRCQTLEAYATAISHFLTDLKGKIIAIEKRVSEQNSIYTLAHVLADLSGNFAELEFIDGLHVEGVEPRRGHSWQRAAKLLNALYERTMDVERLGFGNNRTLDLFLSLFLETFRPFVNMMDVWIREGMLEDRHDEFIFHRHADVDEGDEEFWNGAITIREEILSLADETRQQLFKAGKSMQLLNRLGKTEMATCGDGRCGLYDEFLQRLELELRNEQSASTRAGSEAACDDTRGDRMMEQLRSIGEYDPLLMMNFRRMRRASPRAAAVDSSQKYSTPLKAPFRCPLNRGIENALSHLIYKKYVHNCSALIGVLKRDYRLLTYLDIMRKFFLMEAGDIMFNFYSEVFDLIKNGGRWQDEVLLTITLQDAIAAHYPHHSGCMSVMIDETASLHLHQPIELVSSIRPNCKIPWPVNMVVTNRMQRTYNQIFTFLLQIKWAKYSLDELRFQNLEKSRCSLMRSRSDLTRRSLAPRIYSLRMRLLHFVNNIHTYVMTQSLHTTGVELEQRLNCVFDLEEVVTAHSEYVDRLYHSCLLDDRMSLVRQAIVWVLNLAVNFRSKWDSGVDRCSEKDIREMEEELAKCCKFLKSFHGNTMRCGSFVEWLYNFVLQDWA